MDNIQNDPVSGIKQQQENWNGKTTQEHAAIMQRLDNIEQILKRLEEKMTTPIMTEAEKS